MKIYKGLTEIDFSKSTQKIVKIDNLDNKLIIVRDNQVLKLYDFLNEHTTSFKKYCEDHNIYIRRV